MTESKGFVVASAVAGLLAAGAFTSVAQAEKPAAKSVKCAGINECKGKGGCHSSESSCAGMNSCKGKGVTNVESEQACKDKGGRVVAEKK